MKQKKGLTTSLSIHATSTVSVTLVLLLLGMVAVLALAARSVARDIREHLGFDIVLTENSTLDNVNEFKQRLASAPYVASFLYHSPQEAMDTWQEEMGENLVELLEVNPFLPEFEVNVKAEYACADSLDKITAPLIEMDHVAEVNVHTDVVEKVNRNISTLMLILAIAACALAPISFVLINNTVRLTIYSRRFTIHTMKLVGASRAYIRRPFLLTNAIEGLVAGVLASGVVAAMAAYAFTYIDPAIEAYVSRLDVAMVCVGLLILGVLICLTAAWWATQRYLVKTYDELFH
ncbi:MAG: permease-like cell division protein FtsX [Muribaculaceae bacterium]|nr:permease-like cell division protein FtsX [Muribaculaceae bacterium]